MQPRFLNAWTPRGTIVAMEADASPYGKLETTLSGRLLCEEWMRLDASILHPGRYLMAILSCSIFESSESLLLL